jgi:transglutaminase-like putative cysteine protease
MKPIFTKPPLMLGPGKPLLGLPSGEPQDSEEGAGDGLPQELQAILDGLAELMADPPQPSDDFEDDEDLVDEDELDDEDLDDDELDDEDEEGYELDADGDEEASATPQPSPYPPEPNLDFDSSQDPNVERPEFFRVKTKRRFYYKLAVLDKASPTLWEQSGNPANSYPVADESWVHELDFKITGMVRDNLPVVGHATLISSSSSGHIRSLGNGTYKSTVPPAHGHEYRMRCHYPQPMPSELGRTKPLSKIGLVETTARVRKLASEMALLATDLDHAVETIRTYLAENTDYTDQIGPPNASDYVDWFLFEGKTGSCQHYAAAAATLLRLMGYYANVCVGFVNHEFDGDEAVINLKDAHAWVEALADGIGWVTLDFQPAPERPEDDSEPEEADADGDQIDSGHGDQNLIVLDESEYEPEPEPVSLFKEFEDVEGWARVFARDAKRLLVKAANPKFAGTYETGGRLNTSQLYRVATKDPRLFQRRKRPVTEPVRFMFGYDESGSIRSFQGEQAEAWARARWMIAEGLARCDQDFAVIGYHSNHKWYKRLGEKYDDNTRRRLVVDANHRLSRGGSTATDVCVSQMRGEHERNDASRKTYAMVLTDGVPNSRPALREQVELAHSENLHVIGVVMPHVGQREYILNGLDEMFDRAVVLGETVQEVDDQLHASLMAIFRGIR